MATLEAARKQIAPVSFDDAPQLRVLTCGSVDDGKSTLLGRLLFDIHAVLEDQLQALDSESRRWGTQGAGRDYALLLDGLSAEREQGITIDVAYRYFSTRRRSFIMADTPGHEQYTRNMATGASQADLAIILIDARRGVLPQTRRHAFIAATLGVRHAVLAINKMDLAGFSEARFDEIVAQFASAAQALGLRSVVAVPLCARDGDNVATRSDRMGWYAGPTLLEHLETVDVAADAQDISGFRLPVQLVARPDAEFRGYAGTIAGGAVRPGDEIVALPSAKRARIARIVTADGDRPEAGEGDAVTLTLDREIDIARGDVLAAAASAPEPVAKLTATLLWMADESLLIGRDYALHLGPATASARIESIHHAVDVETYAPRPATWLALNELGSVTIALDRKLVAAPYRDVRALGAFILVDRVTRQTVALGVVDALPLAATAPTATSVRPTQILRPARWALPLAAGAAMAALAGLLTHDPATTATLGLANVLVFAVARRIENLLA